MKRLHAWATSKGRLSWTLLGCVLLLAACATPPQAVQPGEQAWIGRLSLRVDTEPVQLMSGGFDLRGTPAAGTLLLTSPLGNVVASVSWDPTQAEWRQGDRALRKRDLETLAHELGATALPVTALFAWLEGQEQTADGWVADLSRQSEGRITARRTQPLPTAELRVILQRP